MDKFIALKGTSEGEFSIGLDDQRVRLVPNVSIGRVEVYGPSNESMAVGESQNVQPDWTEANTGSDAYIRNKPSTFPPSTHNHDSLYAPISHAHATLYAAIGHDHAGVYEPRNTNIQSHIGITSGNPHGITLSTIGAAASTHNHDAGSLTSGTIPAARFSSTRGYYTFDPKIPSGGEVNAHLSDPTVTEVAIDKAYASNKIIFNAPLLVEVYANSTWTPYTVDADSLARLVMGRYDGSGSVVIPYGTERFRITWVCPAYRWLNLLYMYVSTRTHTMSVNIERSAAKDINTWSFVASANVGVLWPGHVSFGHGRIKWSPDHTDTSYSKYVRLEFVPTWNQSTPTNNIDISRVNWHGYYPASYQDELISWDKDGIMSFTRGRPKYSGSEVLLQSDAANFAVTTHNHAGIYEPANANIQSHIGSTSNPHGVTPAQIGAAPSTHSHFTWTTTVPATAVSGAGYLVNTTSAPVTVNLPAAPADGDSVGFADLTGNFATNNLTIGRNGKTIMGLAENLTVSTNNAALELVYAASTQDWRIVRATI